ncbi:MAG: hypothetical protein ACXVRK_03940 [Gaiellaceae bacterium]
MAAGAGHEDASRDNEVDRAAAFSASKRGCLRGCGTIAGIGVLLALLAYVGLAIYLTVIYHRHPY